MAKVWVQLGLGHESPQDDVGYRRGFLDHVRAHAQRVDHVLLADPSPRAVQELTREWADQPLSRVVWAQVDDMGGAPRAYLAQPPGSPAPAVFTQDRELALRCSPQGGLIEVEVPSLTLRELLADHPDDDIALLMWDPTATPRLDWTSLGRLPEAVCVQSPVPEDLKAQLRACGYSSAGRAWGEAGTNRLYVRASDVAARGRAAAAQAKVAAGAAIVHLRSLLPTPDERSALRVRASLALDRSIGEADVVDPSHGLPLAIVAREDVLSTVAHVTEHPEARWHVDLDSDGTPSELARECHDRHGLWPISFSFPDSWSGRTTTPDRLLSPITPGYPYSFTDPDEYLRSYGTAHWGITHRKAGWDCFRHVEILASGAVPLMPDAADIPRFSMVHYPRRAMAQAARLAVERGGAPDAVTRAAFQSYFDRHLTCEAMARYLVQESGLDDAGRILFVDEQHPHASDYQSTLALVGLKRALGSAVVPMFPAPWIYSDFVGEVGHLYGRGFGYCRSVDPALRSDAEAAGHGAATLDPQDFDAIVVGSISRNERLAGGLLSGFPAERTVWIHGEDSPPTARQVRDLRASGTRVFVRSIESRGPGDPPSQRRRQP